jgi:CubicO group peptidase (beta-lactamase class C family)
MLVERGHLTYDQRITDIWPEFGCRGKEATTLEMVMRHEAGLATFDRPLEVKALTAESIRSGQLSEVIASQKPAHPPGSKRVYHALTRGWILNEVVRRADPAGRTIGEFLLDEISTPLGLQSELRIGLPEELHPLAAPLHDRPGPWRAKQVFLPRAAGGGRIVGLTVGKRIGIFLGAVLAIAVAPLLALAAMLSSFDQSAELKVGGEKLGLFAVFNSADTESARSPAPTATPRHAPSQRWRRPSRREAFHQTGCGCYLRRPSRRHTALRWPSAWSWT